MFNWLKKQQQAAQLTEQPDIRDTLFGDLPLSAWPLASMPPEQEGEPWASFIRAREDIESGSREQAIGVLREILGMSELESRHYLQAWHFLRQLGVQPAEEAKHLYGVIVEVAMPGGIDVVAAYEDRAARYYNYSGAGVVWENPDDSLAPDIDALLESGRTVVTGIGPWQEPRIKVLGRDMARINMLTPGGLHFGQALMRDLYKDSLGGPVLSTATILMQKLIAKSENGGKREALP